MPSGDSFDVSYHFTGPGKDIVSDSVNSFVSRGFATSRDGQTDVLASGRIWRRGDGSEQLSNVETQTAIREIAEAGKAQIRLYYDEHLECTVVFDLDRTADPLSARAVSGIDDGVITTRFDRHALLRSKFPDEEVQDRVNAIVDVTTAIAEATRPEYAWEGMNVTEDLNLYSDRIPDGRPIGDHIATIGWLTVLSPEMVEDFGGRERVLAAPAWRVSETDSGHVVLVWKDHPLDPIEEPEESLPEYLFDN